MHAPLPEVRGQTERVARYRFPLCVCVRVVVVGGFGEAGVPLQQRARDSNSVLKGPGGEAGEKKREASEPPQSQLGCRALRLPMALAPTQHPFHLGLCNAPPGLQKT